jgi:hypothetical protein
MQKYINIVQIRIFRLRCSVTLANNARTLENSQYWFRTDLGLAPTGYTHPQEHPIFGPGQGSANLPMLWLFISSVLYDCFDTQAHSATFCTPNRQWSASIGMVGFVDDNTNQANSLIRTHWSSLIRKWWPMRWITLNFVMTYWAHRAGSWNCPSVRIISHTEDFPSVALRY